MRYPILLPSHLSEQLRALRKAKGWNQSQLGQRMGLSQTRIARIERDPLSVSVAQILEILAIFECRLCVEKLDTGVLSIVTPPASDTAAPAPPPPALGDW